LVIAILIITTAAIIITTTMNHSVHHHACAQVVQVHVGDFACTCGARAGSSWPKARMADFPDAVFKGAQQNGALGPPGLEVSVWAGFAG
jgi:hypothetical protein